MTDLLTRVRTMIDRHVGRDQFTVAPAQEKAALAVRELAGPEARSRYPSERTRTRTAATLPPSDALPLLP